MIKTGKLPTCPNFKVHLELKPDAKPFACRPYPIAQVNRKVFKDELDRLCDIGVLSRVGPSEYLSPSWGIPKKDGRIRFITDFRKLNAMLKRKVYNLPIIQDILKRRNGYTYFTKIDVSMQYYTFELDEESQKLCTTCTPWGNYSYQRLPMGIKESPDIAQQYMESIFRDMEDLEVYIDDVGIFSKTWEDHLTTINKVLHILQNHNFTVNPLKCEWGVKETDWLGYWLTPQGLKPWKKKIQAILNMQRPADMTQLRSFIGGINFYRDMFPARSHMLAPLTSQVGKKKLNWSPECNAAFQKAKAILAKDAFLQYPDHNKDFHIYCDASNLQLGAVIIQNGRPVAYYSRKLNKAQQNYTTGETELLSLVECCREYHTMLYGCRKLHVYTDHKNNTFEKFNTQRVIRWRMFLEHYNPVFHWIKGEKNTLADALSRLPFSERQGSRDIYSTQNPQEKYRQYNPFSDLSADGNDVHSFYSMATDDDDLFDCFVHLPDQAGIDFVPDYKTIAAAQHRDADLKKLATTESSKDQYPTLKMTDDTDIICYLPKSDSQWKIYLPDEILEDAINWYHLSLSHAGGTRLYDTINLFYYNPKLKTLSEKIVSTCDTCQRHKLVGRVHGHAAAREAVVMPWRDVAVDLIGPWTMEIDGKKYTFQALTIIDMVTNLVEIKRIDNKTAAHVALQFENTWLARYPRPVNLIYDQGTEFTGYWFQRMLRRHNIKPKPITTKNPQANAVCERSHQSIGNSLRVLSTLEPPSGVDGFAHTMETANRIIDTAIANTIFALRSTYSSSINTTPGGLVFHRDMVLNIPLISDLQSIQTNRQLLIDKRLIEANRKRFNYDYAVNDQVLKLVYQPNKLDPRAVGPYRVVQVHTNGTVTIQLTPLTTERINIRRIKPYRQ